MPKQAEKYVDAFAKKEAMTCGKPRSAIGARKNVLLTIFTRDVFHSNKETRQ
jgi:hypothetical protein